MKLRYIFAFVFTLSLIIGISACSKSPKDKVIDYLTKYNEWLESGDFQKQLEAAMANDEQAQKLFQEKHSQLVKECGFASDEEYLKALNDIQADPKVVELTMKISASSMKAMQPLMEKFKQQFDQGAEEMKDAIDSAAQSIENVKEELKEAQEEGKKEK